MIIGSGIDLIEIKRVERALENWGSRFLEKIFTARELQYIRKKKHPTQHLAARFAAKEAVLKALSAIWSPGQATWQDIEISNKADGSPEVLLRRNLQDMLEKDSRRLFLSISHTRDNALASVLLIESRGKNRED